MDINLSNKRLDISFVVTLTLSIITPALFPSINLTFFAPFIIICAYKKNLNSTLWLAFLCGLILDLLYSHARLGIFSLNFCLTLLLLYPQTKNFFPDSLTTLPLMTFIFGTVSSLIMGALLYVLDGRNLFSWKWMVVDLFVMPFADAIYAFCVFILPPILFGKKQRKGKDYFLSR